MNKTRQFFALLEFQLGINPFVWFMPLAFGAPLFITGLIMPAYHPGLSSILTVQNLFLVGIVGIWGLAPEMATPRSTGTAWSSGTEFLLTRAIDRPILYRCRVAYLYILVFLMPLAGLLNALRVPDLKATEYSKVAQQECLSAVPGSALVPDPNGSTMPLIFIARGNVLVEEWHFWMFAAATLVTQLLFLLVYPFKYRLYIFYAVFLSMVFLPLIYDLSRVHKEAPTQMEQVFFVFAAHSLVFWIGTVCTFILVQALCERQFCRQQQL